MDVSTLKHNMEKGKEKKILVKDLNSVITCRLCEGYLIDATTLVECLHTFCRGCILRYFESSKTMCPMCNTVYKKKSQSCFRADTQIQTLVYKLVPSLFLKETQRREDFYRSTGMRAGSSCSDDSVIDRERDMIDDVEETVSPYVGDKNKFYSADDSIPLSLEYYQNHLDTTDSKPPKTNPTEPHKGDSNPVTNSNGVNSDSVCAKNGEISDNTSTENSDVPASAEKCSSVNKSEQEESERGKECEKRYLRCPAAVNMRLLQKFIRMKYGLTGDHKVDIIYKGEVLRDSFSLMDVAYTFNWEMKKPMRFFYRIFTPMKIRPIKIINTALSSGEKHLQIVPVEPIVEPTEPKPEKLVEVEKEPKTTLTEETEDQKQDKERLFAHLQLQSKSKALENKKPPVPEKLIKDCVFEYEEPDQEEIKRFAEKRDREWAMQKKLEEEAKQSEEYSSHHFTKKRKKSKHSKNEFNPHKKRKLHAEITSNEKEDLKLKVKITTNGHKHKHHKSTESVEKSSELSSKEKLLQMRQVRLKHHSSSSGDEKPLVSSKEVEIEPTKKEESNKLTYHVQRDTPVVEDKKKIEPVKPVESNLKLTVSKPKMTLEVSSVQKPELPAVKSKNIPTPITNKPNSSLKIVRQASPKTTKKEWGVKIPTVRLERNDQTEKQAQKTSLTFHAYAEKYHKKENNKNFVKPTQITSINTNNKTLDRKLANLQQRCTVEAKSPAPPSAGKVDKKVVTFNNDKPKVITPQYPPGFTVSKIESGVKRKADDCEKIQDKRPSLEITLINPSPVTANVTRPTDSKLGIKRPPPATIPLERIKKSVNTKSGISIIPKLPEKCDNIGALDLSRKSPDGSPQKAPQSIKTPDTINGFNKQLSNAMIRPSGSPNRSTPDKTNVQLSNLQMLSKVATEHSSLNQISSTLNNKSRPQLPNLQTLRNPNPKPAPPLHRMPPKLNEIQKFRPANPQIRNMRPSQNQNIRNIPNPSLLINRQQNQRLAAPINMEEKEPSASPKPQGQSTGAVTSKDMSSVKTAIVLEQKVSEKKEISV